MLFCFLCGVATAMQAQTSGHFKVRTDNFVQIGYDAYKSLAFYLWHRYQHPNNGNWAIDQQALIPIMLEVIKQQQKDIQALREELNQVKDELDKQ